MHSHWACSAALDQAVSITAMTQRVRPLCSHRLWGSTQDKQQQIYIKSDAISGFVHCSQFKDMEFYEVPWKCGDWKTVANL